MILWIFLASLALNYGLVKHGEKPEVALLLGFALFFTGVTVEVATTKIVDAINGKK